MRRGWKKSKVTRRRYQIVHPGSASAKIATGVLEPPGKHEYTAPWQNQIKILRNNRGAIIPEKKKEDVYVEIPEWLKGDIERVAKIDPEERRLAFHALSRKMRRFEYEREDYLNARLWFQTFVDGHNLHGRSIRYNKDYDRINGIFVTDLLYLFYERSDDDLILNDMMRELNKISTATKLSGRAGGLITLLSKIFKPE